MAPTYVIAQGGGPTAVINQTLVGAVLEARRRDPGCRVLGARHGVRGIRKPDLVDLSEMPEDRLMRIAATPGATLGSTRDKPDEAYCAEILSSLRDIGADVFIYIGGNDTAGTQQILTEAASGDIVFVHAPKTIDNDLEGSDHTPGFISAAEFVAASFQSIDLDFRALPGIYAGIVMGRHAGFLTAAAAAWKLDEESGPHLIHVPERAFDPKSFVAGIKETLGRHKRCIIALSEGVQTADGRPLVESVVEPERLERDAHGNLRLSGGDLGMAIERIINSGLPGVRARVDTFGYLPRGHIAMISPVDAQEAFDAGRFAVETAAQGGGSVALREEGGRTVIRRLPLVDVAGKTRHMPDDFLTDGGTGLSAPGDAYFGRLLPRRFDPERPFV